MYTMKMKILKCHICICNWTDLGSKMDKILHFGSTDGDITHVHVHLHIVFKVQH